MLTERLKQLTARPLYLWLLLWAGITLLYLPAWKGGFQQDFQGWMEFYYAPFWDMLNRKGSSIHSFYQLTQFQLYVLTWLFGTNPIPWFLLFTGLHALNGALLYRLSRKVLEDFKFSNASWTAIAGTLLVLFNPSMTEVVVWKAAYHYLIAIQAILWMLLWAREYLLTGSSKWVFRSICLLLLLTLTLELWYTIPLLVTIMTIAYWRAGIVSTDHFKKALRRVALPQFLAFATYLLTYRALYGTWFAHSAYSAAGDDSAFIVAARTWAYEWHLLGFGRFFPHWIRQSFYYRFVDVPWGAFVFAIVACLAEWSWRSYPRWGAGARAMGLFGAWAAITVAIILHYPAADIQLVHDDRYLYLTAFFQWVLVAILISIVIRSKMGKNIVFAMVFVLCLGFTAKLVLYWRHSTKVFWAVQDKFIWKDAPVVLILNMPSNYNGIGIIHGRDTSELPAHMQVYGRGVPLGQVYDVTSYNMLHPWDGAHVIVEDSTHLHVIFNQWGSWWQQGGFGALDRSNALFDVHFIDGGHDYRLTLKERPPGMVILYQQGQEWRVVDMNKIGVEQE
jgi:hypothetical protein